jgi:kumamolisin
LASHRKAAVPGSEFIPLDGAKAVGKPRGKEPIQVTVVLGPRRPTPALYDREGFASPSAFSHRYLSGKELAARHGARPDDVDRVAKFAREHGLEVREVSLPWRSVVLAGTCAEFSRAFGVEMVRYESPRGAHRGITGSILVPEELSEIVHGVLGLHDRPTFRRRLAHRPVGKSARPQFSLSELAELYSFPRTNGAGQHIGVIEFGGGYHRSDLDACFSSLRLRVPEVRDVSVDGAGNEAADSSDIQRGIEALEGRQGARKATLAGARSGSSQRHSPDLDAVQNTIETTMDIEFAGALAPEARLTVYFARNTEQGVFNALRKALSSEPHPPSILSISWGEPEPGLAKAYLNLVDELLRDAAHLGVTVCVSAGDFGALNQSPDGKPAVNFPASSPYVLGCGGTTPALSGEKIRSEAVWNSKFFGHWGASGGGVSRHFGRPPWQEKLRVPTAPNGFRGRGVPDVAGPADPHFGCQIVVGGSSSVSGGTSAVAPLWAGLLARINQALGTRVGYLTPHLYRLAGSRKRMFREVVTGNNGAYAAGPHWNACSGLGSPIGERLLAALRGDE